MPTAQADELFHLTPLERKGLGHVGGRLCLTHTRRHEALNRLLAGDGAGAVQVADAELCSVHRAELHGFFLHSLSDKVYTLIYTYRNICQGENSRQRKNNWGWADAGSRLRGRPGLGGDWAGLGFILAPGASQFWLCRIGKLF